MVAWHVCGCFGVIIINNNNDNNQHLHRIEMSALRFLPTAIAGKVLQSVVSVRPFVFILAFEPTDL